MFCYTDYPRAELFVNGVSQGVRVKSDTSRLDRYRLRWRDVVYQPGAISAVAYRKGVRWAETKVETTGPVARLVLRPETESVAADGESVAYVNLDALDEQGRVVPRMRLKASVTVSGGELVGVENGDETDLTGFRNRDHVIFNGHLSVIVRAKSGSEGAIDVRVCPHDGGIALATARVTVK